MHNIKITYDKFTTAKFEFSIFAILQSSIIVVFAFLIYTADKEIYHIYQ